ncbi:MAG: Aspartyl-tRNA synthetase [Candidatus Collierbacteria bacterium GW2011_GWA2_44_99]|uniref:Aspartyl-tRNA synthetase n=1 Tax=Candidatus Collierbacteria bacterium GW2011_GWA2_44_99 TaxID=1618380 RepID=A0A0G1KPV2_9BACT|nr:MAG: Aspartyl-tRNA synthetase [Candidatus Collierbacteria bacterium GW2011_GWA2_44_99]
MAMAAGLEKVFEIGPVFRANPSFTSRHDTEFTMYDIEMAYVESVHDLLAEEEKMMVAILTAIKEKHGEDIKKIFDQEVTIPTVPFPRISFIEAKKVLAELKVFNEKKDDLNPEEERAIAQYFKDKENHDFVFVYEYPASGRAFYSMRDEKDPTISKSSQLLQIWLSSTWRFCSRPI